MNDRDILRHERFDRFSTFGIENYPDLPVACEAIISFANIATFSGNFNTFCRLPAEPTERNIKTHTDSLLARLEDAPAKLQAGSQKKPLYAPNSSASSLPPTSSKTSPTPSTAKS
jgi:hypothetical protein